ncbi:MAG: hypothetical protein GEU78_18180 [Actinobacteria bacterium]|nr:hypothetical protein [Actinomycetota bacterium]
MAQDGRRDPRQPGCILRANLRLRTLEQELHRTNKALRELAIENTLLQGKIRRRLTGPIRGTRLPAEVKRFIVRAVTEAKNSGMPLETS